MADTLGIRMDKLLSFGHLEKPVQQHLKQVYSCLSIAMICASAGAFVYMFYLQLGLLTVLGSLGFMLALHMTPHTPSNFFKRMGFLAAFAFFSGMSLGPLLDMVIRIEPSIVPTALMGTSVIFLCFTFASLFASDRKFLFLGGILMSCLSWMLMLGLLNIFMGSRLLFQLNLYGGLFVMCGFILYDTQLIVEKRRRGDTDYIWHSVDLFIDFINVFRRLLIILAQKEENKKRRN